MLPLEGTGICKSLSWGGQLISISREVTVSWDKTAQGTRASEGQEQGEVLGLQYVIIGDPEKEEKEEKAAGAG